MKYLNMTDESDFDGNEAFFEENRPIKLSIWDLALTLIFLFSFFGCVYLYFENRTLKEELKQKHLLIMDLGKLLERKNAKQGK